MQTKVVKIDSANIDDAAMKEACDLIRAGELVALSLIHISEPTRPY